METAIEIVSEETEIRTENETAIRIKSVKKIKSETVETGVEARARKTGIETDGAAIVGTGEIVARVEIGRIERAGVKAGRRAVARVGRLRRAGAEAGTATRKKRRTKIKTATRKRIAKATPPTVLRDPALPARGAPKPRRQPLRRRQ